MSWCRI